MTRAEELTKVMQQKQGELESLKSEAAGLGQTNESLQDVRAVSVRAFAAGAASERETIDDVDERIRITSLRLEGLKALIEDAGADVERANTEVQAAFAEEEHEFAAFVREKEFEELQKTIAGLPATLDRLYSKYMDFCNELSELQIAFWRGEGTPQGDVLRSFIRSLRMKIAKRWQQENFRDLVADPQLAFSVWPLAQVTPETTAAIINSDNASVAGALNSKMIAAARRMQRRPALMDEYRAAKESENRR